MSMEIIRAGMLTTVQDMGRQGYASYGFQENGACDKYALQLGNLLAGNTSRQADPQQAAVLEFTMKGCWIRFSSQEVIALTGADMKPAINGVPAPMYCPVRTEPGDVLTMGMASEGLRGYLAVYGGIDVPVVMSSRSTNLKCGVGGYLGRALQPGDVLRSGASSRDIRRFRYRIQGKEDSYAKAAGAGWPYFGNSRIHGQKEPVLRAVPGPQEEAFTGRGRETFVSSCYRVSVDSDRMACRLDGPEIETCHGSDMISDGIVEGSVQVASDGKPIVMMADHQTTGGYAKIGTVISADIPLLAQLRPGSNVWFRFVSPGEAVEAARKQARLLQEIRDSLKRISRT